MKLHELKAIAREVQVSAGERDNAAIQQALRDLGLDPGTFYQELEMTSRFVDTHQDVSHSNSQVMLHSHTFCEILYCRSSCPVEYLVGSDRYRLQKGDIITVPPGVSHRPILPERMEEPYVRDVLWISMEFLEIIGRLFPELRGGRQVYGAPIRTAGTRWESLGAMFRNGVKEAEAGAPGWEAAVVGNTLVLISRLNRAYQERSAGLLQAERRGVLDEVRAYVETHYSQHLTLGDLARRFYVSDSTISHLFKQQMGVSLYRYITQRRLIAAKSLIQEGVGLELTAEQVGFSDYSGFYRAFRQEYGISPREYKRLLSSSVRPAEEALPPL